MAVESQLAVDSITLHSQATKGIPTLPLEIWAEICTYFCVHCREKNLSIRPDAYLSFNGQEIDEPSWYSIERHTLFSLCLTSKRLRYAAQPILYHEFMPGYGDSWSSKPYKWDRRLTSFLRTVAQRRDLAAFVKRIYFHPHLQRRYLRPPVSPGRNELLSRSSEGFPRPFYNLAQRPIMTEGIGQDESQVTLNEVAHALGKEELKELTVDDLIIVLISALPNLEHCSIQVRRPSHDEQIINGTAINKAGVSHLPLKTIDISMYFASIKQFLTLRNQTRTLLEASPRLEVLNIHMCRKIRAPFACPQNLKAIGLTCCLLDPKGLEVLLSSCTRLCRFFYEAAGRNVMDMDMIKRYQHRPHFQPTEAVKSLYRHRTTLESLHLDLRGRDYFNSPPTRPSRTLCDFIALKHLFLNVSMLYNQLWTETPTEVSQLLTQLLPPNIESLHLAGAIGSQMPHLTSGLICLAEATRQGQFVRLKEVRCDTAQPLDESHLVSTMFKDVGIYFGYHHWPLFAEAMLLKNGGSDPYEWPSSGGYDE